MLFSGYDMKKIWFSNALNDYYAIMYIFKMMLIDKMLKHTRKELAAILLYSHPHLLLAHGRNGMYEIAKETDNHIRMR